MKTFWDSNSDHFITLADILLLDPISDDQEENDLAGVKDEISKLLNEKILINDTKSLADLLVLYEDNAAAKIIAAEEVIDELITYISKGESADVSKAIASVFTADETMLFELRESGNELEVLVDSFEELAIKFSAITDLYVTEMIFDQTAIDAKTDYQIIKDVADAEYVRASNRIAEMTNALAIKISHQHQTAKDMYDLIFDIDGQLLPTWDITSLKAKALSLSAIKQEIFEGYALSDMYREIANKYNDEEISALEVTAQYCHDSVNVYFDAVLDALSNLEVDQTIANIGATITQAETAVSNITTEYNSFVQGTSSHANTSQLWEALFAEYFSVKKHSIAVYEAAGTSNVSSQNSSFLLLSQLDYAAEQGLVPLINDMVAEQTEPYADAQTLELLLNGIYDGISDWGSKTELTTKYGELLNGYLKMLNVYYAAIPDDQPAVQNDVITILWGASKVPDDEGGIQGKIAEVYAALMSIIDTNVGVANQVIIDNSSEIGALLALSNVLNNDFDATVAQMQDYKTKIDTFRIFATSVSDSIIDFVTTDTVEIPSLMTTKNNELLALDDRRIHTSKDDSQNLYEQVFAHYQDLQDDASIYKSAYDNACLEAETDYIYRQFSNIEKEIDEMFVRAENDAAKARIALQEFEREYEMIKDLYKAKYKQETMLEQYKDVIDHSQTIAINSIGTNYIEREIRPVYEELLAMLDFLETEGLDDMQVDDLEEMTSVELEAYYVEVFEIYSDVINDSKIVILYQQLFAQLYGLSDNITQTIVDNMVIYEISLLEPEVRALLNQNQLYELVADERILTAQSIVNTKNLISELSFILTNSLDITTYSSTVPVAGLYNDITEVYNEKANESILEDLAFEAETFMESVEEMVLQLEDENFYDVLIGASDEIAGIEVSDVEIIETKIEFYTKIVNDYINEYYQMLYDINEAEQVYLDADSNTTSTIEDIINDLLTTYDGTVEETSTLSANSLQVLKEQLGASSGSILEYIENEKIFLEIEQSLQEVSAEVNSYVIAPIAIADQDEANALLSEGIALYNECNKLLLETEKKKTLLTDENVISKVDEKLENIADLLATIFDIEEETGKLVDVSEVIKTQAILFDEDVTTKYEDALQANTLFASYFDATFGSIDSFIILVDLMSVDPLIIQQLDNNIQTLEDIMGSSVSILDMINEAIIYDYVNKIVNEEILDTENLLNAENCMMDIVDISIPLIVESVQEGIYKRDKIELNIKVSELTVVVDTYDEEFDETLEKINENVLEVSGEEDGFDLKPNSYVENNALLDNSEYQLNILIDSAIETINEIDATITELTSFNDKCKDSNIQSLIDTQINSLTSDKESIEENKESVLFAKKLFLKEQKASLYLDYIGEYMEESVDTIDGFASTAAFIENTAYDVMRRFKSAIEMRKSATDLYIQVSQKGYADDVVDDLLETMLEDIGDMSDDIEDLSYIYVTKRLNMTSTLVDYSQMALLEDPYYCRKIADELGETADQARYAVIQVQAIALSNPNDGPAQDMAAELLLKARDIENVANLFDKVATVIENTEKIRALQEVIKSANDLRAEITSRLSNVGSEGERDALVSAYMIAEQEVKDSQNVISEQVEEASKAVYEAMNIQYMMQMYITTEVVLNKTIQRGSILCSTDTSTGYDLETIINKITSYTNEAMLGLGGIYDMGITSFDTDRSEINSKIEEANRVYGETFAELKDAWNGGSSSAGLNALLTTTSSEINPSDLYDFTLMNLFDPSNSNLIGAQEIGTYWVMREEAENTRLLYERYVAYNDQWVSMDSPERGELVSDLSDLENELYDLEDMVETYRVWYQKELMDFVVGWNDYVLAKELFNDKTTNVKQLNIEYEDVKAQLERLSNDVDILEQQQQSKQDNIDIMQEVLNNLMQSEILAKDTLDELAYARTMSATHDDRTAGYMDRMPLGLRDWSTGVLTDATAMSVLQIDRENVPKFAALEQDVQDILNVIWQGVDVYDSTPVMLAEKIQELQSELASEINAPLIQQKATYDDKLKEYNELQTELTVSENAYNLQNGQLVIVKNNLERQLSQFNIAFAQYDDVKDEWFEIAKAENALSARLVSLPERDQHEANFETAETDMLSKEYIYDALEQIAQIEPTQDNIEAAQEAKDIYDYAVDEFNDVKSVYDDYLALAMSYEQVSMQMVLDAEKDALILNACWKLKVELGKVCLFRLKRSMMNILLLLMILL